MENINIGIANLVISNKLKDSYFNNKLLNESKIIASDFFNVVKKSPLLQLEFKVFNGIECTHIDNEMLAGQYINKAINLFEIYTIEEIQTERDKLKPFINENNVPVNDEKVELYNAINTLIVESLKTGVDVDIEKNHKSYSKVLKYIKESKTVQHNNSEIKPINEEIIKIAVKKFNEKYSDLNEVDMGLLKKLISLDDNGKKELFETYKNETLALLENVEGEKETIRKAMDKIKEMAYNRKNGNDDIIGLHELKVELL